MPKQILHLLMIVLLTLPLAFNVYGESLGDLVGDEPTQNEGGQDAAGSGSSELLRGLRDSTDFSKEEVKTVQETAKPLKNVVSIVVQLLCYLITLGLTVRVMLDLTYITLPFARGLLSTGGQSSAGAPGMGAGGMGMGAGMGMGMGRMGYGGGYGMNRPMGMGMGAGMGAPGMGAGAAPATSNLVSEAALMAVAMSQQPGPNGKNPSALKLYAKDMIVVLILTPIFLVLAITGTITDLGFLIGSAVSELISAQGTAIGA